MKGLTIHQPWAGFVAAGMKRIETRSWPTEYRGEIAIHAGMRCETWGLGDLLEVVREMNEKFHTLHVARGAIIAVATLSDCVRTQDLVCLDDRERLLGNYEPGRWAWRLESVVVLDNPVPCRGMQRIWTVPPEVEKLVRDERLPF